jgi:hypothetical protein
MDSEIYGLTCYHVIPDGPFQQPSQQTLYFSKKSPTKLAKADPAGSTCGIGTRTTTNSPTCPFWLDYQLLKLNRDFALPLNIIEDDECVVLEPLSFELNFFELRKKEQKFTKFGAASNWTKGYLHNAGRVDCHLKVINRNFPILLYLRKYSKKKSEVGVYNPFKQRNFLYLNYTGALYLNVLSPIVARVY